MKMEQFKSAGSVIFRIFKAVLLLVGESVYIIHKP